MSDLRELKEGISLLSTEIIKSLGESPLPQEDIADAINLLLKNVLFDDATLSTVMADICDDLTENSKTIILGCDDPAEALSMVEQSGKKLMAIVDVIYNVCLKWVSK